MIDQRVQGAIACILFSILLSGCAGKGSGTDESARPQSPPAAEGPQQETGSSPTTTGLGKIKEARLQLDEGYRVQVLIDEKWEELVFSLGRGDLSSYEAQPSTSQSGLDTKLKCLNEDCSKSRITLSDHERTSTLEFQRWVLQPALGEVQIDCELPVFFDYELDDYLGESSPIRYSIESLKTVRSVLSTSTQIKSWDQTESSSLVFNLFDEDTAYLTLASDPAISNGTLSVEHGQNTYFDRVSYEMAEFSDMQVPKFMTFKYLRDPSQGGQICYRISLIPELIRE